MKYHAFISYSHADEAWARWVHRGLEGYRVPAALVGRETERGEEVPARVFPVFRDREELPTSADLGSVISGALAESRYLVVICSQRSARSRWVNEEILSFKRLGRSNRVLALIVDGEPNATDGKPGVPAEAECFPPALRHPLDAAGNLDVTVAAEPIAADARPGKDGRADAFLKLLAGVLGVNFDDLKRRDEVRRRRQMQVWLATVSALLLVFVVLAGLTWWQWREAEARGEKIRRGLARSDVDQALALPWQRGQEAVQFLARAVRMDPDTPLGRPALWLALASRQWMVPFREERIFSGPVSEAALSPDGRWMAIRYGGGLTLREVRGATEHSFPEIRVWAFSPDGGTVYLAGKDGEIVRFSLQSGSVTNRFTVPYDPVASLALADDGRLLGVGMTQGRIIALDPQSGELTEMHQVPGAVAELTGHPRQPTFAAQIYGAGCFLVADGAAQLVWPPAGSGLDRAFPQPAQEVAFFGTDGLAIRGADREVHLVTGWAGSAPEGQSFAPEVPPVALRTNCRGALFVGCQDGRILRHRGEASWETVAPGPPQADRLVDFFVNDRGAIGRVFASRSVDMVGVTGPAVQARTLSFAPLCAVAAGSWWSVVGTEGDLAILPQTPWQVPGGSVARSVPGGPAAVAGLTRVGPGFTMAVTLENKVEKWDPRGDAFTPWFSVEPPVRALAMSPGGDYVAVADAKEFRVLDAIGGTIASSSYSFSDGDARQTPAVLWDPAARWCALLTPGAEPSPWVFADVVQRRAETPELPADAEIGIAVDSGLWVADAGGRVSGWQVPGFTRQAEFIQGKVVPGPATVPRAITVSPDGTTVAMATFGGDLTIWKGRKVGRASDLGPVAFLAFRPGGLLAVNDLGIVRLFSLAPQVTLRHEWRLAPPEKGMVLLWTGSAGDGLLATVDRVNGLSVWDDRGRLLGRLAGPRIPGGDLLAFRSGADRDVAWMVGLDGNNPHLVGLAVRPPGNTADLLRWADEVTGERLEPDGSRQVISEGARSKSP